MYSEHLKNQPQSEPAFGEQMIRNAAGGYVFEISHWKRLRRFLILGCDVGSYYEPARQLTLENAAVVQQCLAEDGKRTVDEIVEVSDKGLGIKNDPAILALALATKFGTPTVRKYAFDNLSKVCRIGTHLFMFAEYREAIGGGWGRGTRNAVAKWYTQRETEDLIHQVLKYRQRNNWSQRDMMRLAHPKADEARNMVFDAVCRPEKWADFPGSQLATGFVLAQRAQSPAEVAKVITDYKIPREFIPTQFLTSKEVWDALLPHMPVTALVRNLGNMSKCGLLMPLSAASRTVRAKLTDIVAVNKSRIHPFAVLLAAKTYASGRGVLGKGEWTVVPQVVEALDKTFELAFQNVKATGKRYLLGVDVSGSMTAHLAAGLSVSEAAAAMALITARTESEYHIMGFAYQFKDLGITAKDTLATATRKAKSQSFGGTDTAVAVKWATQNRIEADVVAIYTDNETWAGDTHTFKAMENYRQKFGLPTRLAVVAFTATNRSIAKQTDPLSMDFVGLDASLPQALNAFVQE